MSVSALFSKIGESDGEVRRREWARWWSWRRKNARWRHLFRYRRQRMLLNRGTVIIVVGDRYARMPLYEFAKLAGMEVTGAPPAR